MPIFFSEKNPRKSMQNTQYTFRIVCAYFRVGDADVLTTVKCPLLRWLKQVACWCRGELDFRGSRKAYL